MQRFRTFLRYLTIVLVLSVTAGACEYLPPVHKVPHSFSVSLENVFGPVAGLKLRVVRYKYDKIEKLTEEELQSVDRDTITDVFAESLTDSQGVAQFKVRETGAFTLEIVHPSHQVDWVYVEIGSEFPPKTVELEWPPSPILSSKHLRGNIRDGFGHSRGEPQKQATLSLRTFVPDVEVATAKTNDNGLFEFANVPDGLYTLRIDSAQSDSSSTGYIFVHVGKDSPRSSLSIVMSFTSCGLMYDVEENNPAPLACFRGGQQVTCKD